MDKPKPKTVLDVVAAAFRDTMMGVRNELDMGRLAQIDGNTLNGMAYTFHRRLEKYAEAAALPMTYDWYGLELAELTGRGPNPPCTAEEYESYKTQIARIRDHPEDYQDGGISHIEAREQIMAAYEKWMAKSAKLHDR